MSTDGRTGSTARARVASKRARCDNRGWTSHACCAHSTPSSAFATPLPVQDLQAHPSWRIRRALPEDAEHVASLVRAYWQFEGIPAPRGDRISGLLGAWLGAPDRCTGWLAEDGETPVGYLLAVYVLSLEHLGPTAEIDECFVQPAYRGQGIGAALLEAAHAEFVAQGCTNVSLQVARANEEAQRFYARHGYHGRARYALMDMMLHPGDSFGHGGEPVA